MNQLNVTPTSLVLSFILVIIAIIISYREKLKLEKELIIAIVRMIVQLVVVGFLLQGIFQVNNTFVTLAMMLVMILNASWNAGQRGKGLKNAFINSLIAILTTATITISVLVLSGSLEFTPSQLIPITGMIIGGSMSSIGLAFSTLSQTFTDQAQAVQEKLALGATPYQASQSILKATMSRGLQPTIDSTKTVGLVTLPGMMAGLMFAGIDPTKAILYQIMVMFMMLASTAISTYIATYLTYRSFFSDRNQLRTNRLKDK